jgi:hypothetical protein
MSSGDSKISICSSALNLLGEAAIASLTEDTDAARACAQLYDNRKWSLLSAYPWSFSKKKVQLARLVAAPVSRWRYQFQLPTDRVGDVFALFQTDAVGAWPITNFDVQGAMVLHDHTELWIDYQYNVLESNMPAYFVLLLEYALASDLAMPVTHEATMAEYWHVRAFGSPSENNRGGQFRVATGIDGRGRPAPVIEATDLIDVRHG